MGYISKDIALITEPQEITLAGLPNFVQFESKPTVKTILELTIEVNILPTTTDLIDRSLIRITFASGEIREFYGTTNKSEVSKNVFFVSTDTSDTAENIKQALLYDSWIKTKFEITIPFLWSDDKPTNGNTLNIKAKGSGEEFFIDLVTPNNIGNSAYTITWINKTSKNNDSISGEANNANIELDVYENPKVFLGEDDRPVGLEKIGTYLTTLSKTYAGSALFFELNSLFGQYTTFNTPPNEKGWFNTGTVIIYRFIAKIKAFNSFSFYQSNALYVINGYGRVSDNINLSKYTYSGGHVKLLTNKPKTTYIRGQREYLTFILKDDQRNKTNPQEFSLRICYRAYSTAGDFLGVYYSHEKNRANFDIINTCVLDIDTLLDLYPTAGNVKVSLARGNAIVSNDLEYEVLPECLHTLQQFTFLNRLGGWDTFNTDASLLSEIKPESLTYNKTITPDFKKGNSVETVYGVSLDNTYNIESAPITDDAAEWLKELAASKVKLNNEGLYVIFEDFELKKDPKNKNMHVAKIKYRLSESYTNG